MPFRVRVAKETKEQMAHRIGRMVAIIKQVVIGRVTLIALVHAVGLNQFQERLPRNLKGMDGLLKGNHHRMGRNARIAGFQLSLPPFKEAQPIGLLTIFVGRNTHSS